MKWNSNDWWISELMLFSQLLCMLSTGKSVIFLFPVYLTEQPWKCITGYCHNDANFFHYLRSIWPFIVTFCFWCYVCICVEKALFLLVFWSKICCQRRPRRRRFPTRKLIFPAFWHCFRWLLDGGLFISLPTNLTLSFDSATTISCKKLDISAVGSQFPAFCFACHVQYTKPCFDKSFSNIHRT